jgi:four helix bundle protein
MAEGDYIDPLGRVQAYQLALVALRQGRQDARRANEEPVNALVTAQLLRALGSVGANIAEGYSRATIADRRRFFEYALGSARESEVWYEALALPGITDRTERLVSIRRLLLTMIRTCRTAGRDPKPFEK